MFQVEPHPDDDERKELGVPGGEDVEADDLTTWHPWVPAQTNKHGLNKQNIMHKHSNNKQRILQKHNHHKTISLNKNSISINIQKVSYISMNYFGPNTKKINSYSESKIIYLGFSITPLPPSYSMPEYK